MTEAVEYQIAKLSPKKGDMIVIKVDAVLSQSQFNEFVDRFLPYFEDVGCRVVVLGKDIELQVVEAVQEES